jgi:pimeloyl-ACP methyl ester carboxylesterase
MLEAGAFGISADWNRVLRDLAKSGRVCAYDRPGLGASSDRINPPTVENIARDLASILDRAGETAPIILVGHSNGAAYAEMFAALFPNRVAGLLYVDGVDSYDLADPLVMAELEKEELRAKAAVIGGQMGVAPWVVGPMIAAIGLEGQAARHKWAALTRRAISRTRGTKSCKSSPGFAASGRWAGSARQFPWPSSWRSFTLTLRSTRPGAQFRCKLREALTRGGCSMLTAPPTFRPWDAIAAMCSRRSNG